MNFYLKPTKTFIHNYEWNSEFPEIFITMKTILFQLQLKLTLFSIIKQKIQQFNYILLTIRNIPLFYFLLQTKIIQNQLNILNHTF